MNTWGERFRITLFGESHGPAVGVVIDGLPAGAEIDDAYIAREMARRAPGKDALSTARREPDVPRIISGVRDGRATGAPLTCLIENTDVRSDDYDAPLRPGHADWTGLIKYGGYADRAGGGRFSGRLTAPLVFAGALAKKLLAARDIRVYGRVRGVGGMDDGLDFTQGGAAGDVESLLRGIAGKDFPVSDDCTQAFRDAIAEAKAVGDSVGGVVEIVVFGDTAGLGEPFFGSVESVLSALYFSVPAVKGVEFGAGFALAGLKGSAANDALRMRGDAIVSETNRSGGILGGIANGMPIIARAAIKPTASIATEQDTVDPEARENVRARVRGRHDPCIAPRTVPVLEAVTAVALLDLLWQTSY